MPEEMQGMWAPEMEVSGHRPEKEKTQIYRKNLSIECVFHKREQLQTDCRNTGRAK
jgi:hypothetical protein